MTKRDLNGGFICRLLTLLLVVTVCVLSAANTVEAGKPPLFGSNIERLLRNQSHPQTDGYTTQRRQHVLYSRCNGKLVRIMNKKGKNGLDAIQPRNTTDKLVKLWFESTASGKIWIYGVYNHFQICFNHKGRLIARRLNPHKSGTKKGRKPKYCDMEEVPSSDGYWQFRSAQQPNWYIGFRRNGRPMKGIRRNSANQNCYKFTKLSPTRKKRLCRKTNSPHGVPCDKLPRPPRVHRHSRAHIQRGRSGAPTRPYVPHRVDHTRRKG